MDFTPESAWPALLAEYDRPIPRYTSYPPVPAWEDDPQAAQRRVYQSAVFERRVSMYVHVPFCETLCYYCACNRCITKDPSVVDRYLDALELELNEVVRHCPGVTLAALHWGGGTPNSLTPAQIDRLWRAIATRFPLEPKAEASIEIDPRLTSRDQIAQLATLGFTRLSLGVQDFNVATQRAINRFQTVDQTADAAAWAREFDVMGVNVDLIYGLPHQTRNTFAVTIERVLDDVLPDTVATYGYAHVPWLHHAQRAYERALPGKLEKFGMLVDAVEIFAEAGFRWIGIDHFAWPGSALAEASTHGTLQRTFMGYTPKRAPTLLGVGASSISSTHDAYVQNVAELPLYCGAAHHGGRAKRGCLLTEQDLIRKQIIEGIMTCGVIQAKHVGASNQAAFNTCFEESRTRLRALIDDGLVVEKPLTLELTSLGRLFARNVAACFDSRRSTTGRHASAV